MISLRELSKICENFESTRSWCQLNKLLPEKLACQECKRYKHIDTFMKLNEDYGNGVFKCQLLKNHRNGKKVEVSLSDCSWFSGSKLSIDRVLFLTYCFSWKFSYENTAVQTSIPGTTTSSETICDWFSFCREICMIDLDSYFEENGKIGGPGKIVEIDESKVGKRKYNRGRMVEGSWIFGLIQRDDKKNFRLEICPDNKRDRETLLPLIKKHVLPGTTIYSDMWKAYDTLDEEGFFHETVNHSIEFVNSVTGVHTNTIESNWRPLKNRLERGGVGGKEKLADHLCEYLWFKLHKGEDKFLAFIDAIKKVYQF